MSLLWYCNKDIYCLNILLIKQQRQTYADDLFQILSQKPSLFKSVYIHNYSHFFKQNLL